MASAAEQLAANLSYSTFSKATDLKKRIWFTLLALVVYRLKVGKVKVWKMDEEFVPILKADLELSSIWMALYEGASGL
jgi:preprotein translocase subunit SecY